MNIVAIIPARSGSKSVPDKNIRLLNGKPMLAYSIEHALASKYINRVIVSTDSEKYAEIGRRYGAEVPFLRPAEYAQDTSLDLEVFQHVLKELKERENYSPDAVVQLRPTYPIRNVGDIDAMLEILLSDASIDSVRSVAPAKEIPYKMWKMDEDGKLEPLMKEIPECYNMPRQELPTVYYQNACIDVVRPYVILEQNSMSGTTIYGYKMDQNYDIDTEEEWKAAELEVIRKQKQEEIRQGKKRFVFDIDGVIAKLQPENRYELAEPNEEMIRLINQLYSYGNYIVLNTARGYVTGIDWRDVTEEQFARWGLRYHELHFGKPNADYYIDDKFIGMDELMKMIKE
ncbi:MAG: acylneuraminate cytidylyltransferase [Lachnospiraceae bacterium]|nr:acylneuraminate cytidylyltransferase [Lachnospiraceae bacterium]